MGIGERVLLRVSNTYIPAPTIVSDGSFSVEVMPYRFIIRMRAGVVGRTFLAGRGVVERGVIYASRGKLVIIALILRCGT